MRRTQLFLESSGEMESAAVHQIAAIRIAPWTLHAQVAIHHLHELFRDGESEACPTVLPGHRPVALLKGIEDDVLFLRRNADAGIGDR